jgi:hypothetical protein
MRTYLGWILFILCLVGIGSVASCQYEPVPFDSSDLGYGSISCVGNGKPLATAELTITGTVNEALLPFLDGSWTLCKLSEEQRAERRNYCDVEFDPTDDPQ